ncbi:MAG: dTMP kinase [Clostridia bacterium]|nr:dTMP kinase [Clostridia bacterium]
MTGIFITMEGPDGAGKTTQAKLLGQYLTDRGRQVVFTREPGGTRISEAIRQLVLDPTYGEMADKTEILLYAAARAQHVRELIIPALEEGKVIICDRFIDSTLAYQGYGRGIDPALIKTVNEMAIQGVKPHLTLVFDLEPGEGLERIKERQKGEVDRLEGEGLAFHQRVRQGFLAIAREEEQRCKVVDARKSLEQVHRQVVQLVEAYLKG